MLLLIDLFANETYYVKITKTSKGSDIQKIAKILKRYDLPIESQKIYNVNFTKAYYIYTGPFSSKETALFYQQQLKQYFKNPEIVTLLKGEYGGVSENRTGIYAGVGVGYAVAPSIYDVESGNPTVLKPKNSGVAYNLSVGYLLRSGLDFNLEVSMMQSSDLRFTNIVATINYRFYNSSSFTPYCGLSGGAGSLDWLHEPIQNVDSTSSSRSTSPLLGTRFGIIYDGMQKTSLLLTYEYLFMNQVTNIAVERTNISHYKHQALHSLLFSAQYHF